MVFCAAEVSIKSPMHVRYEDSLSLSSTGFRDVFINAVQELSAKESGR